MDIMEAIENNQITQLPHKESKKERKLKRQEMIKNYRPSPEREAELRGEWERLTYKKLVTDDFDDFHPF